jgi:hypothetical protein
MRRIVRNESMLRETSIFLENTHKIVKLLFYFLTFERKTTKKIDHSHFSKNLKHIYYFNTVYFIPVK